LRRVFLITALAVLALTSRVFCSEVQVTDLSGAKYFPAVREAIAKAQKAVTVVMFTVEASERNGSKPDQLVKELIDARKRGCDVRVVLDQNVDYVNRKEPGDWEPRIKSTIAYKRLKEAGVDVHYDEPMRYAHAKTVIIDERIVILGSTNWTGNAFDNSIETNVMIESGELAGRILEYLKTIKIDNSIDDFLNKDGMSVAVSRQFLENSGIGPRLVKLQAERSFDLYLYLLWKFKGDSQGRVVFFYDEAAKYLGIYEGWTDEAYRRQIIKALRKLDGQFDLIRFKPRYAKEADITLLDYEDADKPYHIPQEREFRIPKEYFELGWRKELSLRAKFCYLINLAYTEASDTKPVWSKSVLTITRQCGDVGQDVISKGMGELRRRQLLEVRYDELATKPYDARRPKQYRLLSLYDPAGRLAELAQVEAKCGAREYGRARKFAGIVFEENNPWVIEEIVGLVRENGVKRVGWAFGEVAKKATDNPKRNFGYVKGMLRGHAE